MSSLYWDYFEKRVDETIRYLTNNKPIPIRRIAVFITNRCNFKCDYCNMNQNTKELSCKQFDIIIRKYGKDAIIHITGGEPSMVKWLYEYIDLTPNVKFHLNSNLLLKPPENIQRLKVSLDSNNGGYFDKVVHFKGAFNRVCTNIKNASNHVVTSITYTMTKENYKQSPEFMKWARIQFPNLYAVFFSIYKGTNKRFVFTNSDANNFFKTIKPKLENEMDKESFGLLQETIDEKYRLIKSVRFPENKLSKPCYISMSERVVDWDGCTYNCSHLFRDSIKHVSNKKHLECKYGCNRRLVMFNEEVERGLNNEQ